MNITARTASEALPLLCNAVLGGHEVNSRAGAVKETLFPHVTLTEPWKREILTTGRRADVVAQIAETLWVLAGRNDVEWLSAYLPRAKDFSDDGTTWRAGYGPRLRNWSGQVDSKGEQMVVDQLANVVHKLKTNPEDRRAVINLWDPLVDADSEGLDKPCNCWLHFLVRDGRLHLHVAIRSNDLMWGWSGINAFEWSAVQELVSSMVGVQVGELHFSISSLHLYDRHWAKAERLSQRDTRGEVHHDSPRAEVMNIHDLDVDLETLFTLEADLRNGRFTTLGAAIHDPMLRSWARVLAWHWTKDDSNLVPLQGTRLHAATQERPVVKTNPFVEWASKLHADKHAVYGDSWKKRGEFVSIQANIARKIDRLGKAGAGDSELDTTTDLLVYLVKNKLWLKDPDRTSSPAHVEDVRNELLRLSEATSTRSPDVLQKTLVDGFEEHLEIPSDDRHRADRLASVTRLAEDAFALALYRYTEQQHTAPTGLGQTHAERNATRSWNPDA